MSENEPLIIEYTREQAIADGVLFPVSDDLVEIAGFRESSFVLGADMMSDVRAVGEEIAKETRVSLDIGILTATLELMMEARESIFKAEDKNTDRIPFKWREYDCWISLYRPPNSPVLWTIFRPSDD